MKKILAFLIVLCMLASTLCIPAFAANDPAASTVLRIKALKNDGSTVVVLKDEDSFEDGWNYAIEQAVPKSLNSNGYKRIIVDFYGNWNANANGEFGDDDGDGFDNTTIYFPDDVKITLNMNGHTINRGLKEWIDDGEVMYINDDADVIINDGTITGGWSANGAGGIHVKDDVKLTLNNVHIIGNTADDADGGGIALGDDTELIMNGGSFKDNRLIGFTKEDCGGAIYMDDSVATFNNVEFKNNLTPIDENYGAVIYAEDSQVTLNNCTFEGNGLEASYNKFYLPIIYTKDSTLTVSGCTFNNNRSGFLLDVNHSILNVSNSVFTGITDTNEIIDPFYSSIYVTNTVFSDNNA